MLLSFIVPFFNSAKKSKRLLTTLLSIIQDDIEIILVDDGSTDNTHKLLLDFKKNANTKSVEVIKQENKGPGGARNAGLRVAKGKYVWFVDSDDDIKVEAIDVVRQNFEKEYDFIDFNIISPIEGSNSMGIDVGEYSKSRNYSVLLLKNFGRIWTKAIRRKFLIDNDIYYPEYCLYEDNPLAFIYPFFVKSFLKSDVVGYSHHIEFESVTRSKPSLRTLDRLHTAVYGLKEGLRLAKSQAEIEILEKKFIEKYLLITTEQFSTKRPSKDWIVTWRMMKQYRIVAKGLDIKSSPFETMKESTYNRKMRSYFAAQWVASFLIVKDQTDYFNTIHKKAWN